MNDLFLILLILLAILLVPVFAVPELVLPTLIRGVNRLVDRLLGRTQSNVPGMRAQTAIVRARFEPGDEPGVYRGKVFLSGEIWQAAGGPALGALAVGDEVEIVGREGLVVEVRPRPPL